jgi:hypothetical protein
MSHSPENIEARKALVGQYIVQADRLGSYAERKAKHQANVAEMQKQIADPSYTPTYDSSAYSLPPEQVIAAVKAEAKVRMEEALSVEPT